MFGEMELNKNLKSVNLPQRLASGFTALTNEMTGADYKPVLFCGTQVVKGMNYYLICVQTLITNPVIKKLVKMTLNESPDGAFSVVSIERM